jgi:hypothetical protein
MLRHYVRAEVIFIHLTTGLLFLLLSGLLIWLGVTREPLVLILVVPVTAFGAWGWWYEARLFWPVMTDDRPSDK